MFHTAKISAGAHKTARIYKKTNGKKQEETGMRKKLAVVLALCMAAGTIGSPAGIREVRAAQVQKMENTTETQEAGGEEAVVVETAMKSAEDDLQSGDFKYGLLEDGTVEIRGY